MIQRQNPIIPEGINTTDEHPLKDFFLMLLGIGLAIVATLLLLASLAEYLVRFIPFHAEQSLVNKLNPFSQQQTTEKKQQTESYLQALANELAAAQQLPSNMSITVHYIDKPIVNAMATLGGHIMIYQGLLDLMPNENALAMVVAHEIAHIKHRDPIVALGRGVTMGVALMSIMGFSDSSVSQQIIGTAGELTALSFSRKQEREADLTALHAIKQHYGHVAAANSIFKHFKSQEGSLDRLALFSTHPLSEDRIKAIDRFTKQYPSPATTLTSPLPNFLNGKEQIQ